MFSALKHVETYLNDLRSTMGINQLHALMSMHVHKNILDIIHLADVANGFVGKKKTVANKRLDIFLKIIHNIWRLS